MRINKPFLTALLFFISVNSFSQEESKAEITNVTKINFLDPGIGYEMRIAKNQSLGIQAFISISAGFGYSSDFGTSSFFYLDPALMLQYRYYYNLSKRDSKGKRTEMNSANYISPIFETVFYKVRTSDVEYTGKNRTAINTLGLAWGLQRNYKRRFSLDLNMGVGYRFGGRAELDNNGKVFIDNFSEFAIPVHFTLGFWLNKRK
jgi:hypothetical protein